MFLAAELPQHGHIVVPTTQGRAVDAASPKPTAEQKSLLQHLGLTYGAFRDELGT
jgi:hypothetical protein